MRLRTTTTTVLAAGLIGMFAWRGNDALTTLPAPAQRFLTYYKALGESKAEMGAWQRVLYSVALAGAPEASKQEGAGAPSRPQSSGT